MLTKLRLTNFKGFKDAELTLGALTLLVGTNASGKSNIRDAFRFLHGISRGYNLAEIIGEKYVEGGVLQWRGIRGGTKEVAFQNSENFELGLTFPIQYESNEYEAIYGVKAILESDKSVLYIVREHLIVRGLNAGYLLYEESNSNQRIKADILLVDGTESTKISCPSHRPILSQINSKPEVPDRVKDVVQISLSELGRMRFLDLDPEAMRLPSFRGQNILGDRGENLSSVLFEICQDPQRKEALLEWVQELTPMDARDFEFPTDFTGKVLLTLVESNGQKISAVRHEVARLE